MPRVVTGSTLVSLATTCPEMVVSVTSGLRDESGLTVGNVLGANTANLMLVVGTAAVIRDVWMDRLMQVFNFPAMLGIMLLRVWMLHTDKQLSGREGVALLAVYAIYLAFLVLLTPRGAGL